jgi:uncharacterized membrane protein YeaQ/YmgE (transglycosylase-associated protein family)
LIIGALARLVLTGSDPMGSLAIMTLGIAGSILGCLIASLLWGASNAFLPGGFFLSLLGAILFLLFVRKVATISS